MKILGVIPARYASSRFPGKPLIDLAGKSMIQRVYEGAKRCELFSDLVVATDDPRIVSHVESFGAQAILTSASHQSGTERCGEVVDTFTDFDIVVNVQGDEPLVDAEQLSQLIKAFQDPQIEIATLGIQTQSIDELLNPNRIKVVLNHLNKAIFFSRSAIPFGAQIPQDDWMSSYSYVRHIGLYAYKIETLKTIIKLKPTSLEKQESLEQLRWLFYGIPIHVVLTNIETPNIDTPDDVAGILDLLSFSTRNI